MDSKLVLLFVFFGLLILSAFRKEKKKKVMFWGAAVAQAAVEPDGYLTIMKNMLQTKGIYNCELIDACISDHQVYNLNQDLEDIISKSPDVVVILLDSTELEDTSIYNTGADEINFEKHYRAVINKLRLADVKVILCTKVTIGRKNNDNRQESDLNKDAAVVRKIANDLQLPFCDLQTHLEKSKQEYHLVDNKSTFTANDIHLSKAGNRLIAALLWEQIEALN